MATTAELDRAFHFIMQSFVERGRALHFTELARSFGVGPEEGKSLLHALMDELELAGVPAWRYPKSDLIASFSPFNNLPTHYRISVGGVDKWFGQ